MSDEERDHAAVETAAHHRWVQDLNRPRDGDVPDAWNAEQCGACRYYVPLVSKLGEDWGACCNARSPFDRRVMFEHDGCAEFRIGGPDGTQPFR